MEPILRRTRTPARLAALQLSPQLLNGCFHEADRADLVGFHLQGLRNALPEKLHSHLNGIIGEIQNTSRLLRDLAEQAQINVAQLPTIFDYLNVILPCLCKTLMDIMSYYEDKSMDKEHRWRTMYHKMTNELPGTTLPARFIMYNQFLGLLEDLLRRSPNFDLNAMESLRIRILQLREARNIPPPDPIRTDLIRRDEALEFWNRETVGNPGPDSGACGIDMGQNSHWAEAIFTQPLTSRREFKSQGRSDAFGHLQMLGHLPPLSRDVKILVKRSFDSDRISVIFFLQLRSQAPFLLIRSKVGSQNWVSIHGVHELTIRRESDSMLHLSRWSRNEQRVKPWANLSFLTWEEMVLFFCTFLCLRVRSQLTLNINPNEYHLRKERRLFQAQIIDDGYPHVLMVFEDAVTGGCRLHAAVWEGKLRACPVWTAFIPPNVSSSWLLRKTSRRIWLRDIQPYVFCEQYRPMNQRKGRSGAFELAFAKSEAATRFQELFSSSPGASSSSAVPDSTDINDVVSPDA
ncbi:uncharacterized protein F4822DRAFT_431671 [Hypoxylon trugodes]|uniref:uncharacterized protein n=1 Tax=Hypoxylon trugodes TaxID=326681 RepID=UPI0021907B77|nr:uncharacterized protein F4822DRAFT_431671 [Hypoxylon trugodes]KAI1386803.1 hypothetical protein F4822DRAFT_431671 [Hypoxylon trugodes]